MHAVRPSPVYCVELLSCVVICWVELCWIGLSWVEWSSRQETRAASLITRVGSDYTRCGRDIGFGWFGLNAASPQIVWHSQFWMSSETSAQGHGGAIRFSMESWTVSVPHRVDILLYSFARRVCPSILLASAPDQNWACVPTSVQPWAPQVQVCKKCAGDCSTTPGGGGPEEGICGG